MILDVKDLTKEFPINKDKAVHALNGVNFSINKGETFGLVGESGSGKSTAARIAMRLTNPSSGKLTFEGVDIFKLKGNQLKMFRKQVQMVFQDPYASLNPRFNVKRIVQEPLKIFKIGTRTQQLRRVEEVLESVGLDRTALKKYPHEFSGGQRQRVSIARAIILNPKLIILDEPVSALDVSIQAQVINLLKVLQNQYGLTYLFISHDLRVVEYLCDQIGIMYMGRLVEKSDKETIFSNALHPYTKALLSAIPDTNSNNGEEKIILSGELPSNVDLPAGCPFSTRCPKVMDVCKSVDPLFRKVADNHYVACHLLNDRV